MGVCFSVFKKCPEPECGLRAEMRLRGGVTDEYLETPCGAVDHLVHYEVDGVVLYKTVILQDIGFKSYGLSWVLVDRSKAISWLWHTYPESFTEADKEFALPYITLELAGG